MSFTINSAPNHQPTSLTQASIPQQVALVIKIALGQIFTGIFLVTLSFTVTVLADIDPTVAKLIAVVGALIGLVGITSLGYAATFIQIR